ncbi:unnamed protein product, partial [Laminaria digitata]
REGAVEGGGEVDPDDPLWEDEECPRLPALAKVTEPPATKARRKRRAQLAAPPPPPAPPPSSGGVGESEFKGAGRGFASPRRGGGGGGGRRGGGRGAGRAG